MLIEVIVDIDLGIGLHAGLEVPGMDAAAVDDLALIVQIECDADYPDEFTVERVTAYGPIKCIDGEDNVHLVIQDKADVTKWLAPDQMAAIENKIMRQEAYA